MEDDRELERKAIEELLKEAKRGKTRAETMGPMGWMKCPLAGANKRFLATTLRSTVRSTEARRSPAPGRSTERPRPSGAPSRERGEDCEEHGERGERGRAGAGSPPRKRAAARDPREPSERRIKPG